MAEIDTIIENLKKRFSKGAIISSPFTLIGGSPNFQRDAVANVTELSAITQEDHIYDIGHIVYCQENGKHYVFRGRACEPNQGEDETKWVGQFQELSFTGGGGTSTLIFNFKGDSDSFESITNPEKGDAYRVAGENYVIPSGSSYNGTEINASIGDIIICVEDGENPKWSILKNNIDLSGYIKVADTISTAKGEIPMFNTNDGTEVESTNIKYEDVVLIAKDGHYDYDPNDVSKRGGKSYASASPSMNVPILDKKGNLIDSQVQISVLRDLQKELLGISATTLPDNVVEGTLADMMKQFRKNSNQLGHSYGVVSATTEESFVNQMQQQLSASTTDQGFVIPITLYPTENPLIPYLFDEFIPAKTRTEDEQVIEEKFPITVEATVRKDGPAEYGDDTAFHLDFEIAKYSLQYWYKYTYDTNEINSILYFVDYGMSNNLNASQDNQQENNDEESQP
jgi:hypothetical protein